MRMRRLAGVAPAVFLVVATLGGAHAATRMFSYDPANSETRRSAGALTFQFTQKLVFTTVLNVRATEGQATAVLKPADEKVLGRGGLSALIGGAPERDLYEVQPAEDGAALTSAFCPGAKRAWMAFGRLRPNRDLRVFVLGDDAQGVAAHLCRTFDFTFHGEWRLPPGAKFDERQLERRQFPK